MYASNDSPLVLLEYHCLKDIKTIKKKKSLNIYVKQIKTKHEVGRLER